MHLMRCLSYVMAWNSLYVRAEHIAGVSNAADSLSRNNVASFRRQVPAARQAPVPVPGALLQVLLQLDPAADWTSMNWTAALTSTLTISRNWRSKGLRGIRSLRNSMSIENVWTHSENCS